MKRMTAVLVACVAFGVWSASAEAWQLTCATDSSVYGRAQIGGQVRITATALTDESGPIEGVLVNFSITKSDGTVVSLSPDVTDADGIATAQWKAWHFDQAGIYTATCSATVDFVPLTATAQFYQGH